MEETRYAEEVVPLNNNTFQKGGLWNKAMARDREALMADFRTG